MKLHYTLFCFVVGLISFRALGQAPVEFIQNKGQWGDWFLYKAEAHGADVLLEKDGFRFVLAEKSNNVRLDSFHHGATKVNPILKFHVYKVTFEGANIPTIKGLKQQKNYYNYFLGNDSSTWKTGIHPYYALDYSNLYKDIDMHVSSEKGHVVYEFNVKPGADAAQIKLKFDGQTNIKLKKGDLIVQTSVGDVMEMKPYVYQYINDNRVSVPCEYVLNDNQITFSFPEGYDHTHMLVIDPTIVFSTLTGSTADNWGYSATYDNSGNFYAGGLVNCAQYGGHFPVSTGAYQTTWGGGYSAGGGWLAYAADISIIKYNSSGSTRIYATYMGGSGNDHVHSMIVDASDNLIIAGRTKSSNYPVTSGCYQGSNRGGWDIVVSKFNSGCTALIGSTYIGGTGDDGVNYDSTEAGYGQLKHNYGDDSRSEVQIDNANNIYVAGCTNSTNFPTTSTALRTTLSGMQDGIVFKMNPTLTSLTWSTYLGGNGSDAAYVLGFDSTQANLYVAGGTNSNDFPTVAGCWQTSYRGDSADGFVCKFQNSGSYNLLKCSYVGTSGYDQVYGIQVDNSGFVYMMGQSIGGTFPVTSGVYTNANSTQFIMKMDGDLTTDLISTVYGSGASGYTNISPVAFLVDTCSNVYVSGWGGNLGLSGGSSGGTTGMHVSSDAHQSTTDGSDFYFIVLGAGMTTLRYATFFGRSCTSPGFGEHVDGGTSRFDKHGIIYQAICASCGGPSGASGGCTAPFPTTTGAWSEVDSSVQNCNEDALKIAFSLGPVHVAIAASPSTSGCAPLTISFTNLTVNGLTFLWNFGDGTATDTAFSPTHTFVSPGNYIVTLSAANSNACFVTNDTLRLTITVDSNSIRPDFTTTVVDSCGPYNVSFTNTSVYGTSSGASSYTIFHWYFGDGTSYTGTTPPLHNYADTGTYTITLVMIDTTACNSPDSITKSITLINTKVSGSFVIPDSVCVGTTITPVTSATNAISYTWTYADSITSSGSNPSFVMNVVGTFTVTLVVRNPGACNGADTFTHVISVMPAPTANFSFVPITAEENTPTTFTNLSTNATRYSWDFGDGSGSAELNPVHQFNKTGTYKTCLTAYNNSNCPSIACKEVPADVVPIIGLPSGFSPNGDGENDILYVRGAAIKTLDLKIYNRWGQMIFETQSKEIGWDGTFNGQPQPIDAYGYVLNVSFIDGSSKVLKGNITLLR